MTQDNNVTYERYIVDMQNGINTLITCLKQNLVKTTYKNCNFYRKPLLGVFLIHLDFLIVYLK